MYVNKNREITHVLTVACIVQMFHVALVTQATKFKYYNCNSSNRLETILQSTTYFSSSFLFFPAGHSLAFPADFKI